MRAVIFILVVALILCLSLDAFAVTVNAENIAYLSYRHDTERQLLFVSLNYFGEAISAIGTIVEYDTSLLDYTGYTNGRDLSGFDISATLENSGRIKILAHSGERYGAGEVIVLCFKIKDTRSADECAIGLFPLSSKPVAVIESNTVRAVDTSFMGVSCEISDVRGGMSYGGRGESGEVVLSCEPDIPKECIFDITVVELSGKMRRKSLLAVSSGDGFALDVGELGRGYTSLIVEPYYYENGRKTVIERGIYLFYEGEYIG